MPAPKLPAPGVAGPARRRLVAGAPLLVLAGCATYHPLPLPRRAALAPTVAALRHPGIVLPARLGVADIALLAVENDPAPRAASPRRRFWPPASSRTPRSPPVSPPSSPA